MVRVGSMDHVWHKLSDIGIVVGIYIFRFLLEYIVLACVITVLSLDLQEATEINVLEMQLVVVFILFVVHI